MSYNPHAARSEIQRQHMEQLEKDGVCAFCPENIESATGSSLIFESEHWQIKHNDYPYKNTKLHLLIVSKYHVNDLNGLPKEAKAEFLDVVEMIEKKYDLESLALGLRLGDFKYNGGSVYHLHAHVVVGDTENPAHEPVRFKMSSRPSS